MSESVYSKRINKVIDDTLYVFGGEDGAESFTKFKHSFIPALVKMLEDGSNPNAINCYNIISDWGALIAIIKDGKHDSSFS